MSWQAVATYRTDAGPVDVTWEFEELHELHDLVERGPDWATIIDIRITMPDPHTPGLTVEQAGRM